MHSVLITYCFICTVSLLCTVSQLHSVLIALLYMQSQVRMVEMIESDQQSTKEAPVAVEIAFGSPREHELLRTFRQHHKKDDVALKCIMCQGRYKNCEARGSLNLPLLCIYSSKQLGHVAYKSLHDKDTLHITQQIILNNCI